MQVISNNHIVCFDVDDTLVMWNGGKGANMSVEGYPVKPHDGHIKEMMKFKARGQYVIVWSAGGSSWAHTAVKLLGLEPYVDLVMAKPMWMFDDMQPTDWTRVIYKEDK